MEVFIAEQLKTVVESLILGLIFGAGYDIIRVLHVICGIASYCDKKFLHNNRLAFVLFLVLDMIFMLFVTAAYSIFLYHKNNGVFRLYLFLTCIGGFVLYYNTCGRLVMLLSEAIVKAIKMTVNLLIIRPLTVVLKMIYSCLRFIEQKTVGKIVNVIYVKNRQRYMQKIQKQMPEYIRME